MKEIIFLLFALFINAHLFSQPNSFAISVEHPDLGMCDFEFYKYSTRPTTQQVFLWDGVNLTPQAPGPVRTYRGRVVNHPNYKVFAVWYPGEILYIKALPAKGEKDGFKIQEIDLSNYVVTPLNLPVVTEPHKSRRILRSGYSCTYPDFIDPEKGNGNYETLIAMWENGVNLTDYFCTRDIGLSITCDLLIIPIDSSITEISDIIKPIDYPEINEIEMFWKTTGGGGGAGRHLYCNSSFQGGRSSFTKSEFGAMPHELGHTLDMGHYLNQYDAMHSNQYFWGRNSVVIATAHLELSGNLCLINSTPNYADPVHPWTAEDYATTNRNTAIDIDVLANDIDYNEDLISIKSFDSTTANGGTVTSQNGILRYEPAQDFIGRDFFLYTTESGSGTGYFTNSAKVLIEVRDDLCPLALHYSFEEDSGAVVEDKAWGISSQNATLKNSDFSTNSVAGVVGNAISLPTETDGVILNDILDPMDRDLSVSIWFKLYELPTDNEQFAIFDSGTRGNLTRVGIGIKVDSVGIHFLAQPEAKDYEGAVLNHLAPLVTNQWYHAVMVVDRTSNTLKAYVNGVEVTYSETNNIDFDPSHIIKGYPGFVHESNPNKNRASTTLGHQCGAKFSENKSVLKGAIDELKIYTKILTAAEVNILYTTPGNTSIVDDCDNAVGVDSITRKLNLPVRVSPIPASDYIKLSGITSAQDYIILNAIGQEIKTGTIKEREEIDIEKLKNGLYFLKLENGNTLKFVKQ